MNNLLGHTKWKAKILSSFVILNEVRSLKRLEIIITYLNMMVRYYLRSHGINHFRL